MLYFDFFKLLLRFPYCSTSERYSISFELFFLLVSCHTFNMLLNDFIKKNDLTEKKYIYFKTNFKYYSFNFTISIIRLYCLKKFGNFRIF